MENSLNLYHIFFITAKCKNISRASRELYISQPAVSKAISRLEENLGCNLFHRNSRGVNLTMEGELLFSQISSAFQSIQIAEDQIQKINQLGISQLSIGVSSTLCKYILIPYLKEFVQKNPHINITISCNSTSETLALLDNNSIDIGLIGINSRKDSFEYHEIKEIQDTFVTTNQYLENLKIREGNLTEKTYGNATFMMLEKENLSRKYVDSYLNKSNFFIEKIIEVSSMDLLIDFAKADLGIACVIKDFVKNELDIGLLKEISVGVKIPKRSIGFVYSKKAPLTDAMNKFINHYEKTI